MFHHSFHSQMFHRKLAQSVEATSKTKPQTTAQYFFAFLRALGGYILTAKDAKKREGVLGDETHH